MKCDQDQMAETLIRYYIYTSVYLSILIHTFAFAGYTAEVQHSIFILDS